MFQPPTVTPFNQCTYITGSAASRGEASTHHSICDATRVLVRVLADSCALDWNILLLKPGGNLYALKREKKVIYKKPSTRHSSTK